VAARGDFPRRAQARRHLAAALDQADHPAVTAAIIGPRTMEQLDSQLPAAEVTLTADILDRIDQLVAPGVTINPDDNSYGEAELTPRSAPTHAVTAPGYDTAQTVQTKVTR
jgi:hypothetical protein